MRVKLTYFLFGILFGVLALLVLQVRHSNDIKEIKAEVDQYKNLVEKKKKEVQDERNRQKELSDELIKIKENYDNFQSREITDQQADSLQKEEIRKGIIVFGPAQFKNSQASTAAAYGNQAFDVLENTISRLKSEEKVSEIYHGITVLQDTIINKQMVVIEKVEAVNVKTKVKFFGLGSIFGAIVTVIIML